MLQTETSAMGRIAVGFVVASNKAVLDARCRAAAPARRGCWVARNHRHGRHPTRFTGQERGSFEPDSRRSNHGSLCGWSVRESRDGEQCLALFAGPRGRFFGDHRARPRNGTYRRNRLGRARPGRRLRHANDSSARSGSHCLGSRVNELVKRSELQSLYRQSRFVDILDLALLALIPPLARPTFRRSRPVAS